MPPDPRVHPSAREVLEICAPGSFGNDPHIAATTARDALLAYGDALEIAVFAIPERGAKERAKHEAFARVSPSDPEPIA